MTIELNSKHNVIELAILGQGVMELEFRWPTVEEQAGYRAARYVREGGQVVTRVFEPRLEYGMKVATGFTSGPFTVDGEPLSSTPGESGYRKDWKRLVARVAPGVFEALAVRVFDNVAELPRRRDGKDGEPGTEALDLEGDVEDLAGGEDETDPLARTSGKA